jgi:4-hydroxy-3-polyprenylbenzoate decarboxylase
LRKIVVAITGGSGYRLGERVIELLPDSVEKHIILSESAEKVALLEEGVTTYKNSNIGGATASGSFGADAMIVVPASMNTVAKIAVGIADNLITRTASVMLKERKQLLLAPRELPFGTIHLENMHKLSSLGVIIAPPVMGYYSDIETLDDMERFIIGKWFDALGVENSLYKRWS